MSLGALRVLDTGLRPARENVALSAALLEGVSAGRSPPTLRFHRYAPSVVIGRFQDVEREAEVGECGRLGIELARRTTGGGAVVMGPGVLAFDLALPGADPGRVSALAGDALAEALGRLGIAAERAGTGSVEAGGRKLSGSAGRLGRAAVLHQATLVLDLAETPPLSLLRRRTEGGRPTPDPAHRVTSLAAILRSRATQRRHADEPGGRRSRTAGVSKHARPSCVLRDAPRGGAPQHDGVGELISGLLVRALAARLGTTTQVGLVGPNEERRAGELLEARFGRDAFVLTGDEECGRRAAA